MKQRGRKSAAELSVATTTNIKRTPPPKHLAEKAADIWRMVMASPAAELISPEAFPVLVDYCRSIEQADILAKEIESCDPAWLRDDEGLKRFDKLLAMQERQIRITASCAVKLRLTPSTRVHRETAARIVNNSTGGDKPWDFKQE